jgi:mRNA-degrading endonuclease RelE of RelBE toxin-antitoxin system
LEDVRKDLNDEPEASPPFSFRIEGLGIFTCVIKIKKIASDSFKGRGVNSGLRLIYAYFEEEQKIIFVELYHKNEKENEDRQRIAVHFE